ncbi:hypothetical protein, partial [uncultured Desulfovibrio sp.]|uniref:hypothetical protein n=1 Tax=uncultured Desulfovibrio sp. TaxID=167968 RepID=UPI00261BF156
MTRHAQRRAPGGKSRGQAEKKTRQHEIWQEDEDFPVLDDDLLLRDDPAASGRQRRGKRPERENAPQAAARPDAGEGRARSQARPSSAPARERTEQGKRGRGISPFRDGRRAGEPGDGRPSFAGRRQEGGRTGAYEAEATAGRRQS